MMIGHTHISIPFSTLMITLGVDGLAFALRLIRVVFLVSLPARLYAATRIDDEAGSQVRCLCFTRCLFIFPLPILLLPLIICHWYCGVKFFNSFRGRHG